MLDRGFKFSFLSKEVQRHLRILARRYKVEGYDQELIGKGVSSQWCSFNVAVVISNAISNFVNQSSPDAAKLSKLSNMKGEEHKSTTRKKTKRTSPGNSGYRENISQPMLIVAIFITITRIGSAQE